MKKELDVYEALDIMREDQRQFEKTAAELKSKETGILSNVSAGYRKRTKSSKRKKKSFKKF